MRRWLAIANPHAGAFRFADFRQRWMPCISSAVERVEFTEAPGHATEIARAAGDYDGIVVVGGDGTLFEVLAATVDPTQLHAIIPAGRGNCMALDLGLGSVPQALRALDRGDSFGIDLMDLRVEFADGSCRSCRAASTLAAGYVARVVERASGMLALRRHAYAAAAVLTRPKRFGLETRYDGLSARALLTGVVVNNTRYLANFHAFPAASLDDGLLDVLEVDADWGPQMLHNASVLSRGHFHDSGRAVRAANIALDFAEPELLMVDGELLHGVRACAITSAPAAARFIRESAV